MVKARSYERHKTVCRVRYHQTELKHRHWWIGAAEFRVGQMCGMRGARKPTMTDRMRSDKKNTVAEPVAVISATECGETTKLKLTRNVGNEGNAVSEHFERVWDEGGSVIAVGFASRVPSRLSSFHSANWRRHQTRFLISFCSFVFLVVPFPCLVLGDSAVESDLACSTRTCAGPWRFQQHPRVVARVGSRWRTRRCVDTIWTYCGA